MVSIESCVSYEMVEKAAKLRQDGTTYKDIMARLDLTREQLNVAMYEAVNCCLLVGRVYSAEKTRLAKHSQWFAEYDNSECHKQIKASYLERSKNARESLESIEERQDDEFEDEDEDFIDGLMRRSKRFSHDKSRDFYVLRESNNPIYRAECYLYKHKWYSGLHAHEDDDGSICVGYKVDEFKNPKEHPIYGLTQSLFNDSFILLTKHARLTERVSIQKLYLAYFGYCLRNKLVIMPYLDFCPALDLLQTIVCKDVEPFLNSRLIGPALARASYDEHFVVQNAQQFKYCVKEANKYAAKKYMDEHNWSEEDKLITLAIFGVDMAKAELAMMVDCEISREIREILGKGKDVQMENYFYRMSQYDPKKAEEGNKDNKAEEIASVLGASAKIKKKRVVEEQIEEPRSVEEPEEQPVEEPTPVDEEQPIEEPTPVEESQSVEQPQSEEEPQEEQQSQEEPQSAIEKFEKVHNYPTTIYVGLCDGRHDISGVIDRDIDYIYNTLEHNEMNDFVRMESIAKRWIRNNMFFDANGKCPQYLCVYTTGYNALNNAIIKVAMEMGIGLTCMIYDKAHNRYLSQFMAKPSSEEKSLNFYNYSERDTILFDNSHRRKGSKNIYVIKSVIDTVEEHYITYDRSIIKDLLHDIENASGNASSIKLTVEEYKLDSSVKHVIFEMEERNNFRCWK